MRCVNLQGTCFVYMFYIRNVHKWAINQGPTH